MYVAGGTIIASHVLCSFNYIEQNSLEMVRHLLDYLEKQGVVSGVVYACLGEIK